MGEEYAKLRGLAEPQPTCEWREEDPWGPMPDTYATSCGELWSFTDGGPAENRVKFCHRCGKPVTVVPYPQPEDDDADGVKGEPLVHIPKDSRAGKPPCGECHLQPGETCDICGATNGVPVAHPTQPEGGA